MSVEMIITLVVCVVLAGVAIYLAVTKQWEKLRMFAYMLMLKAERLYTDENGDVKFKYVLDIVYLAFPIWLKKIYTEDMIAYWLQEQYDIAKDFLDDGEINGSEE